MGVLLMNHNRNKKIVRFQKTRGLFLTFFFLILSFSQGVLGNLTVGDFVLYQGSYQNEQGQTVVFDQKIQVKGLRDSIVDIVSTVSSEGEEQSQNLTFHKDEIVTTERMKALALECEPKGGRFEKIKVLAGEFQTCFLAHAPEMEVWLGEVPLGVVKRKIKDQFDVWVTLELKSYKFGEGL
jgi:hypothetical protein